MAKGSDSWGKGEGLRVRTELVLALLVAATLVGVLVFYYENSALSSSSPAGTVATVSTTGLGCNDPSMPQAAQDAENDPAFVNISDGECYNYMGGSSSSMEFAYYNGTISYPCGDSPVQVPASEIIVNLTSSQAVSSAQLVAPPTPPEEACGPTLPVEVVAVDYAGSTIPAVPQINVTLAVAPGGSEVATLKAVLTLDGGSQRFSFVGPLAPSAHASNTEIVLPGLSYNGNEVYPMRVSGTFVGGQTFSYVVHVQVADLP